MGGVASYLGGLRQRDRLRGGREAPRDVVEAIGGQKAAECYVKRDFGGGKGAELEIRQAWRERRRQGHRGVRRWDREQSVSGCWDGDR